MKPALHSLLLLTLTTVALAQAPPPAVVIPPAQVYLAATKLDLQPVASLQGGALVGPWASVARAMGARVNWYADESLLVIVGPGGKRLQVQPGSPLTVDKASVALQPAAVLVEGKLVGPLKPLVDALDGVLNWDHAKSRATIWGKLLRVEVRGDEQGVGVSLVTSIPVAPVLQKMPAPRRAFVDLEGVVPNGQPEVSYVNACGVIKARVGLFKPSPPVTRIVLDLAETAPEVSFQPREDDCGGRLALGHLDGSEPVLQRPRPKLLKIMAASHAPNTLTVTCFVSDPIKPVYDVLREPYRVLVDVPGAEIKQCILPAAQSLPFLDQIRLMEQGRVVLYMDELVPFSIKTLTGPDRIQVLFARDQIAGKKIMVDAGHGGKDSGARGSSLFEKTVNLDVAKRTVQRLAMMQARPFMTRDSDVFIDLYARPRMTNELPADLFVSIHCNATGTSRKASGTGTYYCHPQSKNLAIAMQDALWPRLARRDDGVRQARFCVVRETQIPAVLVELLFIDNPVEEKLLARPEVRQKAAEGVAEGLRRYLEGSKSVPPALLVEPQG